VEEKAGILSANQYQPGDFVSMDQFVSGTPGRLFTGYGREAQHNRFQGGTIFNDAASGAIRVEHQVSLGAGETICAKERFEEWLYEQCCAEVKRYHSDNGVFTAAEFREDCDLKLQQQTFSGVGAKHQNGRAERAIQTIMSMARTFMIHVALHWDEQGSDAVALWPFAVRHAVWLHNRLPNAVTGLSPLEILSGTCSDHRDLLRTHVWGCPVYVLDPKLQDGQKIPKWNRRARQGQYLGFSDEHSSLVANVRHLSSGYVSPQFHVVFDDRFHTVHGTGKDDAITETICDLLWENDREIYAEDEHGPDGSLIYTPPPLDKVWLDEEGLRDRRTRLLDQRRRVERQIRHQSQAVPTPTELDDPPPPPNGNPVISDDSVVVDFNHDDDNNDNDGGPGNDDSSTDSPIIFEPEGDAWADHGDGNGGGMVSDDGSNTDQSHSTSSKPSTTTPKSSSESTQSKSKASSSPKKIRWEDKVIDKPYSREGDSVDMPRLRRNPKWSRKKLEATANLYAAPSYAQIPPAACRLSRKKQSYRQRRARRLEVGDQMLLSMDNNSESFEEYFGGPLAQFIKLAAADSGMDPSQTSDLLVKMVHPLFLKAKAEASKLDNPSWKQAMGGQFADEFWKAAVKEY
jgi:hypothetical protein